jgi:protein tyrosine/serine phosphatase
MVRQGDYCRLRGQQMHRPSFSPSVKRFYDRIAKFKVAAIGAPPLILALAIYSFAPSDPLTPTSPSKRFLNVTIKNFGQMDNHFYRGAQPKQEEYKQLAELGVKTIIDLRDDPLPYADKAAEDAHMHYFNIPMSDKDYPRDESIEKFLNITNEASNWPFYVHCAGGRHRSGVMGAIYRFNHDEWSYERAYEEMKNYDFYTRFGHGALKKFVENYRETLQTKSPHPSSGRVSASQ